MKKKSNWILFGILVVAAFVRLYRISDYLTFLGDEGRDVLVVWNILHGHLTLLGPTASVGGFFLGPIYYYFMAPFLWLFHYNPTGPAVMVALFGIATVWFVYKIGKEFFNITAGLLAASLYAIAPLIISYSHSSWNPNLMPFFSLLTLYLVYKAVEKNKTFLFVLSGLSLGIAMQLHYLTVFIGAILAIYIFSVNYSLGKKKFFKETLKNYASVFVGFLIGWSPFLAFEARHGFQNIKSILSFVFNPTGKDAISTHSGFIPTVSDVFFRLFGRLVTDYPPPEQVAIRAHANMFFWYWAAFILALGSFGLFVYQYKKINDNTKKLQLKLLLFWFVIGVGLFGLYRKNIYDYYFGFMFPLPFLLVGNFLVFLWNKKSYLRYISAITFLALVGINLQGVQFRYPANKQLAQAQTIARFVLDKTDAKPFNFGLISSGNSDHAYRYFFKIAGRDPVEIAHGEMNKTTVTDQLLVVCEEAVCQPLGDASWEIAGFGRAEIAKQWTVSVVRVYKLTHYTGK